MIFNCNLVVCCINNNLKGIYSAPDCYKADEKELEEFDKLFPFKIKEKI